MPLCLMEARPEMSNDDVVDDDLLLQPAFNPHAQTSPDRGIMSTGVQAWLVGGGIGSMAAAAFMIRDGGMPGASITILEAAPVMGGSLDGAGNATLGYSLRGGRMLTTDNYECTWDLYKTIPSLRDKSRSVFDETLAFNEKHKAHSMARLVDRRRAKVPVSSMGFSMQDRVELLKLSSASEDWRLVGHDIREAMREFDPELARKK